MHRPAKKRYELIRQIIIELVQSIESIYWYNYAIIHISESITQCTGYLKHHQMSPNSFSFIFFFLRKLLNHVSYVNSPKLFLSMCRCIIWGTFYSLVMAIWTRYISQNRGKKKLITQCIMIQHHHAYFPNKVACTGFNWSMTIQLLFTNYTYPSNPVPDFVPKDQKAVPY